LVASLSVASNGALVVLKLVVGFVTGAVSVFSEALHSGLDLVAAVIALLAVRAAARSADERHPYGHGKFENISGAIEALLIFVAAGWIVYEAIDKLRHPSPLQALGWAVAVMLFSATVNAVVARMLFRCGRETQSVALLADGWHLLTDVFTSVGVMIALAVIMLGKRLLPGVSLGWVDPVAAIAVALLIVKAAWDLTRQSMHDLLDTSLPAEEREWIGKVVTDFGPAVCGFHGLRTRQAGPVRYIELHLLVAANMSVEDSHALVHRLTDRIRERFASAQVIAHVEPADDGGADESEAPVR
jgi:cation diffusion facilitator family transporter